MVAEKSSYLLDWKTDMRNRIRLQFSEDEISDKQIEKYLDDQIKKKLNDRKIIIVNNYNNRVSRATILELIELIRNNHLIVGGAGCLFLPHGQKRNLLIEFIDYIKTGRSLAKKKRKQFPKGSIEWAEADREQLAFKLIINSLYGCLGYPGFIMFNIFLAEAITNEGRNIITSAINAVENFVGDAMWFENAEEVSHVMRIIHDEYMEAFNDKEMEPESMANFAMDIDFDELPDKCAKRWIDHCIFTPSQELISNIKDTFHHIGHTELLFMYFKNNLMEFSRLSFMKAKNKALISANGEPLMFCEDSSYSNDMAVEILKENWKFLEMFVLYDHQNFDRMRKAMYLDKTKSLYTDTDSVFISLNEYMKYLTNEVYNGPEDAGMNKYEMEFTTANVTLSYINRMIDHAMQTLCRAQSVTKEYAKILNMKNEFYFSRIMFCDVKKRYISNAVLQEGQKLFDSDKFSSFDEAVAAGQPGLPEIKGFDFKKAGTKPYVRDYYTDMALQDILYPDKIDPGSIFRKMMKLRQDMIETIEAGNMEYFKQSTVKKPEYYKNPYSTQGVCAIMLWNALMPEKALDYPIDVNIIPIHPLTYPKPKEVVGNQMNRVIDRPPESYKPIAWFKDTYPEAYEKLYKEIYCNVNPLVRHMNLSSIAVPKNIDYELPDFIKGLYDITSIINNTMSLGLPMLKSVGIKTFQVSTNLEHMSNMISL